MPLSATEQLAGILIGTGGDGLLSNLFVTNLQNADPSFNQQVASLMASGNRMPSFATIRASAPEIPFASRQVASVLARLGLFGDGIGTAKLFYRTENNLDGLVAVNSSAHTAFSAASALGYVSSITAGQETEAVINGTILPVSDGTNAALTRAGTEAIAHNPDVSELFYLGPMQLDKATVATELQGCDDLQFNLNPMVTRHTADNVRNQLIYAAVSHLGDPAVTFTSRSRSVYDLVGPVEDFVFTLARMENRNEPYALTAAQHIKFVCAEALFTVSGKRGDAYQCEIRPLGDTSTNWSNTPFVVTVNSAIDSL